MQYKKIMILAILLVSLLTVSAASAAENATDDIAGSEIQDDNAITEIDNDVLQANQKTFTDLNNAINGNGNSDVYLSQDYTYNQDSDSDFAEGVLVNRTVTVHGNGHTIDGSNTARIFAVFDDSVVFRDIIFVNGRANECGGAISGNCTAVDCTFRNNVAVYDVGGAMYYGSAVNCTFINNSAMYYFGGAAYNCSAVDCIFINNSAGDGGAIYEGSAVNCTFNGNYANYGGAACSSTIENCTFIGNKAYYGGAMRNCIAVNSRFVNNSAVYNGGAMENSDATYCTFVNNYAASFGGAADSSSVCNSALINNSAGDSGGALWGSMEANNNTFINNSAVSGGAIKINMGYLNDNVFIGNTAENGGAIYGSSFESNNCIFINNSAVCCGGAVDGERNAKLYYCLFVNNSAEDGGAVYKGSVYNSNFTGNTATEYGGAICDGYAKNCLFNENTAGIDGNNAYDTSMPYAVLAANFASSSNKLFVNMTSDGVQINGINITIRVYKNGALIGTYYCLSGDGWVADLGADEYLAVLSVEHNSYDADPVNVTLAPEKVDTVLTSQDVTLSYNDGTKLVATLKDVSGNTIGGAEIKFVIDMVSKYATTDANGQASLDVSTLTPGNHSADISFAGTNAYGESSTIAIIMVNKMNTALTARNVLASYNDGSKLVATLKDAQGKVISGAKIKIVINKVSKYITTDASGQVSLDVSTLAPANYSAAVTFVATDFYSKASATAVIIINKMNTVLTAPNVAASYNDGSKLVATLKDAQGKVISGAKIKIVINKVSKYITTDAGGQVSLDVSAQNPGNYAATITFVATDLYNKATTTANIVVNKMDTYMVAPDVSTIYQSNKSLVVALKDINANAIAGAKIKIVINKVSKYITTDANGQVSLSLSNLAVGNYTATITFVATDFYNKATATSGIAVDKMDTFIEAADVTAIRSVGGNLVAGLKDANGNAVAGAKLKIVLNKVTKYITTDANGQVSLSLNNLNIGNYAAAITFVATNLYNKATASANVFIVDKMDTSLTAPDVVAIYHNSGNLVATLKDANGNAISGAKLKIVLNKVTKYITTDANGQVALSLSNLDISSYSAAITFVATDIYNKATATANVNIVQKMDTTLTVPTVTASYNVDGNLVATLNDANGNPISGAKLKIVIPNKITKYITTDANGQVSLDVSKLDLDSYTATVTFVATDLYNKATATASIFVKIGTDIAAPNVLANYHDGSKLVATLKDSDNKAISGAKLKIVLNKVTKYITTDANGQVALSLNNLNPGSYEATITYVATDLYNKATATANVTIV